MMQRIGSEMHLHTDEARSGETPHIVRYILILSLLMVVAAMSVVWISGAMSQRPANGDPVTAEEYALGS
jgi:hypothetical protein